MVQLASQKFVTMHVVVQSSKETLSCEEIRLYSLGRTEEKKVFADIVRFVSQR